MVAQRAIDVVEVGKVVVSEEAFRARILLAERVFGVEGVVASMLTGDERGHIGRPGGHAIAHVHVDAVLQHAVHNAAAENRAEPAAHINHRGLQCHISLLFIIMHPITHSAGRVKAV